MKRTFGMVAIGLLVVGSISLFGCGAPEEKKETPAATSTTAPQAPANPNKPGGMKAPGIKDSDG